MERYDVVVVGGGAAGLTASGVTASLGAKTLLVEGGRLGGDCTWTGCVPSKTLLKAAETAHRMRVAHRLGLVGAEPRVLFAHVMERVRTVREGIYHEADSPERLERLGIEVALGRARLLDRSHLVVAPTDRGPERHLRARRVILTTGAYPDTPPIRGLEHVPYLTSETLFELTEQPKRLLIVGGGPIGIEMAQAFARLGTAVVVVSRADRILSREDEEAAAVAAEALTEEGVDLRCSTEVSAVRRTEDGAILAELAPSGGPARSTATERVDALLIATGRRPNLDGLGLAEAGVRVTRDGVWVDRRCRTSARNVYAAGDVTGHPRLTHLAEHMGKIAAVNAVLRSRQTIDLDHLSWCTFTDPEVARVGASEHELRERGARFEVHRFPYRMLDRAITDDETHGLVKVCATKWRGKILGATIVGARAGDLIAEWAVAMRHGLRLRHLADTIHPYPTYALANRRAADQWYVRRRPLWLLGLMRWLFRYRGELRDFPEGPV